MESRTSKTALITGASDGIGAEFARQLAAKDFDLILIARRKERLDEAAKELHFNFAITTHIFPADLTISDEIEKVEEYIAEQQGVDMLINNAGFGMRGMFYDIDISNHMEMINLHIIASVRLTRASLPWMIARGKGNVINVSSMASMLPVGNVTYGSTKAYLKTFSEKLQVELSGTGVDVQVLCPGMTYSGFHDTPEYSRFDRNRIPKPFWSTSEYVVRESLKAMEKGKIVVIPGALNRVVAGLGSSSIISPILRKLGARVFQSRRA